MTKHTINVTQDDIDAGVRRSCFACPIALALSRTLKGDYGIDSKYILHRNGNNIRDIGSVPMEANLFMITFDRKQNAKPFIFEIEISI